VTAPTTRPANQEPSSARVDLDITGMTCASCAMRIEKKLNRLDGVEATVNYATERARVAYDGAVVTPDDLVAAVESAGYQAALPPPAGEGTEPVDGPDTARDPHLDALRQRLVAAVVLTVPVLAMAMIPALQFENWQWLSLTLASPVVVWGAWPFHRAAWVNLRHGAATMDTLISLGTLSAYLWSLYALFIGEAGAPGRKTSVARRMPSRMRTRSSRAAGLTGAGPTWTMFGT